MEPYFHYLFHLNSMMPNQAQEQLFLPFFLLHPEDGVAAFLRNIGTRLRNHRPLHLKG
jgi:hypothetical protein